MSTLPLIVQLMHYIIDCTVLHNRRLLYPRQFQSRSQLFVYIRVQHMLSRSCHQDATLMSACTGTVYPIWIISVCFIAPTGRRFCAAKSTPGRGRLAVIKRVFFLFFLDLARAQRGLFRRCSPQGAPNGPPSSCSAHCRARGGCRPSATAEVWLRRASVRPPA